MMMIRSSRNHNTTQTVESQSRIIPHAFPFFSGCSRPFTNLSGLESGIRDVMMTMDDDDVAKKIILEILPSHPQSDLKSEL
jgi:hypothetical protein